MTGGIAGVLAQPVLAQATEAVGSGSGAAEFWVFWLIAPLSLAAAISVVLLKNPVHAALMLVVNFFTFAVLYAVLQAQFLATIQIIVYAGAIMILFLFVLMLLGVDRSVEQGPSKLKGQGVAALLLGVALFVALTGAVAGPYMGTDSACNASTAVNDAVIAAGGDARPCAGLESINDDAAGGNVVNIGRSLFTDYVWPFEVTSVLLVVAAIGAMVLGKRRDNLSDLVDVGTADAPGVMRPHAGATPVLVDTTPDGRTTTQPMTSPDRPAGSQRSGSRPAGSRPAGPRAAGSQPTPTQPTESEFTTEPTEEAP